MAGSATTPLMRQYLEAKEQYPDAILFFRLGDFYEMFYEDAVYVARVLDLQLTTRDRDKTSQDAVPMCGVPHHSATDYITRLLELGHRVALCEQVEDPRMARGIVKRKVTRVVTPGVVLDIEALDAKRNCYLAAVVSPRPEGPSGPSGQATANAPAGSSGQRYGLAMLDVSTGEFWACRVDGLAGLVAEILRFSPREIVGAPPEGLRARVTNAAYSTFALGTDQKATEILGVLAEDLEDSLSQEAAACALGYAQATQPGVTLPVSKISSYAPSEFLVLDDSTQRNLELFESMVDRTKKGSLLSVLDKTETSHGARLLRAWMASPLRSVPDIRRRQDAVEFFVERSTFRQDVRKLLGQMSDVARLAARARLAAASPRELGALRSSLAIWPSVQALVREGLGKEVSPPSLLEVPSDDLSDLSAELGRVLVDDPPIVLKDGGYVRPGVHAELDELREIATGGRAQILAIETRERERTGIGSLKVKYNRVFGYYIEVTRSNLKSVPDEYIRKQTLAGAERYATPELAEYEAKVLGADERSKALELEIFDELRTLIANASARLLDIAAWLGRLDVLTTLAEVAHHSGYVRPVIDEGDRFDIVEGRHPVVEALLGAGRFVPNDIALDPFEEQMILMTGPNMAGKSTILRQVALIQLMAQMGSFVPAAKAALGVADRIFTRVGAADNLSQGDSTFMVEMRETSTILAHATRKSLVVLDEIGRGTSTYDGVSIAWAVAEHLHDRIGCKTLFATHYHELCGLAGSRPRIANWQVAVKEWKSEIVFLHKLVRGASPRSYGIEVARLAGLPREVVARAKKLLAEFELPRVDESGPQMSLFGDARRASQNEAGDGAAGPRASEADGALGADGQNGYEKMARAAVEGLRDLDISHMTPVEALLWLTEQQKRLLS